jgi:hypothetical protein
MLLALVEMNVHLLIKDFSILPALERSFLQRYQPSLRTVRAKNRGNSLRALSSRLAAPP